MTEMRSDSPMGTRAAAINLAAFDLNLLVAFEAIMRERNVTRAARCVGLSQSAMSHTLGRLRDLFGDRLFVRSGNRMAPTGRALELAATIDPALAFLRETLLPRSSFDAATSTRRFVIGMNDATVAGLLPVALREIRRCAPGVGLKIVNLAEQEGLEALQAGTVEAAFDIYSELPSGILRQPLIETHFVGLADRNNPLVRDGPIGIEAFLAAPHLRVALQNQHSHSNFDYHLGLLGHARRIVCQSPFFTSAPELVRNSDLITVIGRHAILAAADPQDFVLFELPVAPPKMVCEMIWHPRSTADAGIAWLRDLFARTIRAEEGRRAQATNAAGAFDHASHAFRDGERDIGAPQRQPLWERNAAIGPREEQP